MYTLWHTVIDLRATDTARTLCVAYQVTTWKSELVAMEQRKLSVKEQHFCLTHEMTGQELAY